MIHPGYPNGAATGLLVKDYRGKDANQEVWKFDSALEARLADDLKQAAIEEGQWTEKRQVEAAERKARINRGRDRLAAEKAAALARGEVWLWAESTRKRWPPVRHARRARSANH